MNIFSTFDKIDVCISKIEIMSPILIFLLYQIGIFHVFFNSLNICWYTKDFFSIKICYVFVDITKMELVFENTWTRYYHVSRSIVTIN
jgi:hypothetical protein